MAKLRVRSIGPTLQYREFVLRDFLLRVLHLEKILCEVESLLFFFGVVSDDAAITALVVCLRLNLHRAPTL